MRRPAGAGDHWGLRRGNDEPTNHATQIARRARPTCPPPSAGCCEHVVVFVDLDGDIPCHSRVDAQAHRPLPQRILAHLQRYQPCPAASRSLFPSTSSAVSPASVASTPSRTSSTPAVSPSERPACRRCHLAAACQVCQKCCAGVDFN